MWTLEKEKEKIQERLDEQRIIRNNKKRQKELALLEKQWAEYKIINDAQTKKWKDEGRFDKVKKKPINKGGLADTTKRYKITRKFEGFRDDIVYVDDYMKDYVLNPIWSIESSQYTYFLHSIYDTKENKYINEICY